MKLNHLFSPQRPYTSFLFDVLSTPSMIVDLGPYDMVELQSMADKFFQDYNASDYVKNQFQTLFDYANQYYNNTSGFDKDDVNMASESKNRLQQIAKEVTQNLTQNTDFFQQLTNLIKDSNADTLDQIRNDIETRPPIQYR